MTTRFIFFDLGNVLLRFSIEKLGRQGAKLLDIPAEKVIGAVYGDGMMKKVECEGISDDEFYELFCDKVGKRPPKDQLSQALNDIFSVLEENQIFVKRLADEGFPRGILSNVGTAHWNFCIKTFPFLLEYFPDNHVLSYRVGAMKPSREIYEAALQTAQNQIPDIRPEEILFIDDLAANILGAKEVGLDAVQFVDVGQLNREFERRGFRSFSPFHLAGSDRPQ